MQKKEKRGGARKGSGRPKKEPTTTLSFRVPIKKSAEIKKKIHSFFGIGFDDNGEIITIGDVPEIKSCINSDISGIYKITCLANNKIYYGSSKKIAARFKQHINALISGYHNNKLLLNDFTIYGINNFSFEIVELCEDLYKRERFYLRQNKTGYNQQKINDVQ